MKVFSGHPYSTDLIWYIRKTSNREKLVTLIGQIGMSEEQAKHKKGKNVSFQSTNKDAYDQIYKQRQKNDEAVPLKPSGF